MTEVDAIILHLEEKIKADAKRSRKIRITAESVTVGSLPSVDIELKAFDKALAVEIKRANSQWWIVNPMRHEDVRVNGRKVELDLPLKHGDQILIDQHLLTFEVESKEEYVETRPYPFRPQPATDSELWNYLLEEKEFDEILINGISKIYVDWQGNLLLSPWRFLSEDFLKEQIFKETKKDRDWISWRRNRSLRFQAALPPQVEEVHLAIRKARQNVFTLDELEDLDFGSPEEIRFLKKAVEQRASIIISGATSTGKTVLLRSLVQNVSEDERLLILEEEAETDWPHPHAVSIETGRGKLREALIESLRMRPSRIIVSEVRGEEAFEFLQAINTGHEGGMTTVHANSARDALSRLENLILSTGLAVNALAVRSQLASAIDLVVQLERLPDGKRRIESISRISGIQKGVILLGDPVQLEGSGFDVLRQVESQ